MIKDIIEKNAFNCPFRIFLEIGSQKLNYLEFNNSINDVVLSKKIPDSAKNIALRLNNATQMLVYIFACNRLNKIPVILPANSNEYEEENNPVCIDYEISDNNCIIQYKNESKYFGYKYNDDDVQCIIFSSGTSGLLKGVELTFGNIYYSAKNLSAIYPFDSNDVYLNVMPLYHVSGLSILFRSIYFNFFSIINVYKKRDVLDVISKKNVTCLSVVPKMIYDFSNLQGSEHILSKLKFLLIGGDMINQGHYNYLSQNKINAYVSYGTTETASSVAGYWINNQKEYIEGYIGESHPNVSLSVLDGCINVKSNTIMKRYYGESLAKNIYQSTDQAEIICNHICFTGRNEHQIVSGGENINLNYIQRKFDALNLSRDVVITSFKNLKWGDSIVLLYEANNKNKKFINEINQSLIKCFPKYMIPQYIFNIPHIPRYENGKVNYSNVKAYLEDKIQ